MAEPTGRLHYIDWLRVSAFALLILYHCSVAFFPDLDWLMKSPQTSKLLSEIMMFPRAWRLALLFFISGMGTWFAFRRTTAPLFLKERFMRLFVPLIFAMCVIIVPQVWYERMAHEGYEGSLFTFWITRYFTEGVYPSGNFTWAHMWFVAYLLVMTIICVPIFLFLQSERGKGTMAWFEKTAKSPAIYAFFVLPLVLNVALSPFFPRETNKLYDDGAWFAVWASWFGLGFLIARHHASLIGVIVNRRWVSFALMLVLTFIMYRYAWWSEPVIGSYENQTILYKAALFALAWTTILTLIGFGALYLNRQSRALTWLNSRIFPLYIVHQTIILGALFYLLPLQAGIWTTYALVILLTVAGSLLFAVLAGLLPARGRMLVGLFTHPEQKRVTQPST
jgi:glucan biosynthesis protein C